VIVDQEIESYIVCRGLFRDRGILHRDISPANILWDDSGPTPTTGIAEVPTIFLGHLLDPRYVSLHLSGWFELSSMLVNRSINHP